MKAVEERVSDRRLLNMLRMLLSVGVMKEGLVRREVTGTPQGAPVSALLANVYLHQLDRAWCGGAGAGVLVRFCDDLVVLCRSRREAERALEVLTAILADLGLEPKAAKTRIVHLVEGGEGLDFLGFHHRWVRSESPWFRHVQFLARWPSRRAMQHVRDRIRELTGRDRLLVPIEVVVAEVNSVLRGWAGFFRYGNSARHFVTIRWYALGRLARFVAKKHQRRPAFGRWMVGVVSGNQLGLVDLSGIVIAPRPNKPWREKAERRR
ncbi:reverse transcriptase domain-containing protein [Frankia sp. CiP3]